MISIIIPCKILDEALFCYHKCKELNYKNFEIIIITDNICDGVPAKKRDFGAKRARGDILAFIDSDAYPPPQWLKVAERYITDFALGGPNILPPNNSLKEQISDQVYKHLPFSYRVKFGKPMLVKEMPACNLFVKKKRFFEVGGFGCEYLTGEDTILCKKLGGCLYIPELYVYHRRRPIYHPLLKQVSTYARQRGMFFRAYLSTIFTYIINFIKGLFK